MTSLYVATENDTIYAINAATGAILLQQHLGTPVRQSTLPGGCNNNSAVVGINSTPVIDDRASNTLYVMVYSYERNTPVYRLQALDLGTLHDKVTPAVVHATARLSDGSHWSFDPAFSRQRNGLLEANGNIYAGFASFCDVRADLSRGWLLGWRAGSLTPLAGNHLDNTLLPAQSPNDFFLSSIWASWYGVAADTTGDIYFVTGNSDYSGTTYSQKNNLSESVIRISPDLRTVLDFFTPAGAKSGVQFLDRLDADFGSGGVLLIPPQPGNLALATAAGKAGLMYLLDRRDLGRYHDPDRRFGAFPIGPC
jgi:hypothetical protein